MEMMELDIFLRKKKIGYFMNRKASLERVTKETNIKVSVNIDGKNNYNINTGIGFLDHMLEQLSKHSFIDIDLNAKGDLHIDYHHTTEDSGYALGKAIDEAIGDRKGISRFAHAYVPMDETLTRVVVDFSGRPYLVWKVFSRKANLEIWILSYLKSGSKPLHKLQGQMYM